MGIGHSCTSLHDELRTRLGIDEHEEKAGNSGLTDSGHLIQGESTGDEDWALPAGGQMSVMMFGMSGAGKSALGNLIADMPEPVFYAGDDTASVTNLDSVMKWEAEDDSILLLDTIGLGDTEISQEKVVAHIRDVALSAPNGIDVLLLVMRNARITDDTIARITYATEFLWGKECLLNLYVIITFAPPKYTESKEDAHSWIQRQCEINWRFKHIYSLVDNNPNRFIFVDNPDPDSMEPNAEERRALSRIAMMRTLCLHPKDAVPAFTSEVMQQAKAMLKDESKALAESKEKLRSARRRSKKVTVSRLPGRTCRIVGSDDGDNLSLQGKEGTLQEWDPSTGKWSMLLQDGRTVSVRMGHLKLVTVANFSSEQRKADENVSSEQRKAEEKEESEKEGARKMTTEEEEALSQIRFALEKKQDDEIRLAEQEKKKAEEKMAKKVAQVKADKKFEAQAAKQSQEAAVKFSVTYEKTKDTEDGARSMPKEAASRIISALKSPFRRPSKKQAEAKGRAELQRSTSKQVMEEAPKSRTVEKETVQEGDPDLDVILRKIKDKIRNDWKSTPEEVFKHLGGPRGASEIWPFSFNMFMQSAEPGITRVAVGSLWRRADANCDGKLSMQEFTDLLSDRMLDGSAVPEDFYKNATRP